MLSLKYGAGKESRTLDLNLGKVALYQLSYSRPRQTGNCRAASDGVKIGGEGRDRFQPFPPPRSSGHARRRYRIIDQSVSTAATTVSPMPIR